MQQRNRNLLIAAAAALVLILAIAAFVLTRGDNQDRLTDEEIAEEAAANPEERCASQATYDLIKRELFRRASQARGSDQAAFDQLAAYATVRMERPVLESYDDDLEIARCSGMLALDLPPGVAVVGGRRTLMSQIDYSVQGAADRSGEVVTISNAEPIIIPLATLARTDTPADELPEPEVPLIEEPADQPPQLEPPAPPEPPQAVPQPEPTQTPTADPSFKCRFARTRSEIEICNNPGLAALDRQMTAVYNRSMAQADAEQRALLRRTRDRFLGFREACRSESCIAQAYRGRIREISDIMAGQWTPPR